MLKGFCQNHKKTVTKKLYSCNNFVELKTKLLLLSAPT